MSFSSMKAAVNESIVGLKLARDVIARDSRTVLLTTGAEITQTVINRFLESGIQEVYISVDTGTKLNAASVKSTSVTTFEDFKRSYVTNTTKLNALFEDILTNKNLDITQTSKLCVDIIKSNDDKYNVFSFLDKLRTVDDYLYAHSINVATLSGLFGKWLGFAESDVEVLTICGLLHDIGKTRVDIKILRKEQKLTHIEFAEIKSHTVRGYEMLRYQEVSEDVKDVAYMHHEKIDGLGYPRGLQLSQINAYARVISIVDIFDAMSHARVYRKNAYSPFYIIKEFQEGIYGKLDLEFLSVFLQNVAYIYVGSQCILSDGRKGKIVFVNPSSLHTPIVDIEGEMIDLQFTKGLKIDRMLMV